MKTNEMKKEIRGNVFDGVFTKLYHSEEAVKMQKERYVDAINVFEKLYGEKDVEIYSAPGRTEIGGNHTDHQMGKVLAASIDLDAIAIVAKEEKNIVKIKSEGYPAITVDLDCLEVIEEEKGRTEALVRGVANGLVKRGYKIGGFEAYITSNVLRGSGLSSSAAYEVLIGTIFSGLYNQEGIDSFTIAKVGQEAEMNYFGKPCGLMDQMACSVGGMIYIDFAKDTYVKKLDVDFNQFEHSLCIVDTKGSHADLTDEYAAVPAEMKAVAEYFGKELLFEVDEDIFYNEIANIREKTGDRAVLRSMHWFAENKKVEKEAEALQNADIDTFKQVVKLSGESSFKYLQNVFATKKSEEQGIALALALSESFLEGKGVCRVHGGGFAGTMQAFVPNAMVNEYKAYMESYFGSDACYVLQIRTDGGVKVI